MNHQVVLSDFSFAMKPEASASSGAALSSTSEETETSTPNEANNKVLAPLELESQQPTKKNRGFQIKKIGKTLGGALQKINVVKWIDDLEQDQELADHLDRINADTADEQERQMIRRQAMEACLKEMRNHLLEFLADHPQATYEEWICNLHPDNINTQLDGLTHIPMIDHRFYVADSDHRILWNEHLNDLEDETNLNPVRHFVAARTFAKKPSGIVDEEQENGSQSNKDATTDLIGLHEPTTNTTQQQTSEHEEADLLSM